METAKNFVRTVLQGSPKIWGSVTRLLLPIHCGEKTLEQVKVTLEQVKVDMLDGQW